ncbi:UvrD-helicase domain-containing protein [Chitinophaga sp. 22536]|uniref:UvrD-helicase domain-containing protein n=1 Tax=unclassified Chitinophaga TaxID=2619133 RepID=UPI003F85178A
MKLTQEQLDIIHSTGNIKINAVAGAGKTTTIIEYAKSRPNNSKILYLAFNKSVRNDAIAKFAAYGLTNVKVETAHSLAYKRIVFREGYTVRNQGYRTNEIADLLEITGRTEKHGRYILANHINKFFSYFCNSDKSHMEELDYLEVVTDKKVRAFVKTCYQDIQRMASLLYQRMDDGDIEITHDFYLKKFQLERPDLGYDYILFDEGQDASAAMLDIFLRQKAIKVIVGDTHQQIYSWRYAVNSLEKVDFKTFHLSTSFRFGQDIADLATEVLKWKEHLDLYQPFTITGEGGPGKENSIAVIARTNLGLLLNAIDYIEKNKNVTYIYFEGNINSYAYADDGTSLYDVLNFINSKRHLVKDSLIREMKNIAELEEYIEHTEDVQLATMLEIAKEYGDDIHSIMKELKRKHVADGEKEKAAVIFSTVHRSKGMEYDQVILADDFITEEKLKKMKKEEMNVPKLNEEINLLYVAITRTRNIIQIPESMIPTTFPASQITVETKKHETINRTSFSATEAAVGSHKESIEKAYSYEEVRLNHKDAYMPWTAALDNELTALYCKGVKIKEMAKYFGRTDGAIRSRIKKLELEETYGKRK